MKDRELLIKAIEIGADALATIRATAIINAAHSNEPEKWNEIIEFVYQKLDEMVS